MSMFIHHSLLWGSVYPEGASGSNYCTVELGYSVMKGTEYFVSLCTSVVKTEGYNVVINSDELTRTIGVIGEVSLKPLSL
jgi:hypothetical protein